MRTSRQLFSVLGAIVSVNTSKRKSKQVYRFYVKEISEIVTAEDMITYRPSKLESFPVLDYPNKVNSGKSKQIFIDQPLILAKNIEREAAKKGITTNPIIQHIKSKLNRHP